MSDLFAPGDMKSLPPSVDLAGSRPLFTGIPGAHLRDSLPIADFSQKRLLFNQFNRPGQIHVYSAECRAGERLRTQMYVPVLPRGGAVVPAFALVAQSLPYSADVHNLPVDLPHGFSAIVAPPPSELLQPVQDVLTARALLPRPAHRHTYIGGWSLLSGGVESAQPHGQICAANGPPLASALELLGTIAAFLVADSRLVRPRP